MHQFKLVHRLWTTYMFCCDDKSMNEEEAKVYALGHIWGKEEPIKNPVKGNNTTHVHSALVCAPLTTSR